MLSHRRVCERDQYVKTRAYSCVVFHTEFNIWTFYWELFWSFVWQFASLVSKEWNYKTRPKLTELGKLKRNPKKSKDWKAKIRWEIEKP